MLKKLLGWWRNTKKNDPVYSCSFYKEKGCSHVDGFLCDMKTCSILKDHLKQKEVENISCPVCGYYCSGNGGQGCIDKPTILKTTKW